jgi:bacteriorhodopsin
MDAVNASAPSVSKDDAEMVPVDHTLRASFMLSYMMLVGVTFITLIEALRTQSTRVRHIMNLETSVSFVAGVVYSYFMLMVQNKKINYQDITELRYMDWCITTPMLLLVIILFFNFYNKKGLDLRAVGAVLLLNYLMLLFGYWGETGQMSRMGGWYGGMIPFIMMLAVIWFSLLHDTKTHHHRFVFLAFAFIWSMYGVAYLLEERYKHMMYNALDVISKGFFGVYMWVYYGGVVDVDR